MIFHLLSVIASRKYLLRFCALLAVTGVLEGGLYVVLVSIAEALARGSLQEALGWIALEGVLAIAFAASFLLTQQVAASTIAKTGMAIRQNLGAHALRLPLGWFMGGRRGMFARQVSYDSTHVAAAAAGMVPSAILSFVAPIAAFMISAVLDWRFAVIFAAMLGAAVWYITKLLPQAKRIQQSFDEAANELAGRAIEFSQAQMVLRAAQQAGQSSAHQLDTAFREQRRAYRDSLRHSVIPQFIYAGIIQIGILLILLLAVHLAVQNPALIPALVALLVLVVRFAEPLSNLVLTFGALVSAQISLDSIESTLHVRVLSNATGPAPQGHEIVFEGVDFSYRPNKIILHHADFAIPAGSIVAITGESGAGKSTILRLIARFWDANSGRILIGGVDVRKIANEDLVSWLSLAAQQPYLFDGTIKDNVLSGNPKATVEQLERAAYIARLDEIIERMPKGWESRVGEGGSRLSGGERQRVALARALVKDAPILLLDEATAALDAKNERLVRDRLQAFAKTSGRTIVMVTHHASIAHIADIRLEVRRSGEVKASVL